MHLEMGRAELGAPSPFPGLEAVAEPQSKARASQVTGQSFLFLSCLQRQGRSFGDRAGTCQHSGSRPGSDTAFSCATSGQPAPRHPAPPGSGADNSPFLSPSPSEVSFL